MRHFLMPLTVALCTVSTLSACKIVKTPDPESEAGQTAAAANMTDEERMTAHAQSIWADKVVPTVKEHLVPLTDLRALLATGLDAAGQAHGLRPEGEANPWNFAVSGTGKVIAADTAARAAKIEVDTDADGAVDVTLQLGPVMRGTSLRDAMPFLVFTDFRDQIEFAKLARALNAMAHDSLTIPEGDITGKTVTFEGVFTLRSATDPVEIVPTALTVE